MRPAYAVNRKLRDDVEGTCSGKYVRARDSRQGYIIKVVSVLDVGQGKVMPGTGLAEFRSQYQAVVLKPVRAAHSPSSTARSWTRALRT
mgnify:FL=1